ncbi:Sodium-dependent phosphate transporter 1-A [Portunus trituberculatus]|uniref:Sodium-dependent phosphate transporter 1-A n=1 Tax=Portunus trituberculatus TaxID=210409 RepID=A0A5B7D9X2_PORTR|nr:Sodium-dependent phosphate transporter 1-A [Portunus trituberculatus]
MASSLIRYKVSDTVRKGILDVTLYNDSEKELMLGSLAALGGSAIWNLVATFFKLPISGTHTIVGATVGFSLCARGFSGVNWITFGKIGLETGSVVARPAPRRSGDVWPVGRLAVALLPRRVTGSDQFLPILRTQPDVFTSLHYYRCKS